MRKSGVAALLVAALIISVSLPLVAGEWEPGVFWKWEGASVQSPSYKVTVTIYVLTSVKVLDAEVYVLGQINRFPDTTFVTLGEAMRRPDYPTYGFDVQFHRDTLWMLNPPGWESEKSWRSEDASGTTTRRVEAENVVVTVPAGTYWNCKKLSEHYRTTRSGTTIDETDTIWYSTELDWPVRFSETVTIDGVTHSGTIDLVETGTLDPAEAVQQLLAAIDEMEEQHAVPSADAYVLRRKLLSLGLFNPSSP